MPRHRSRRPPPLLARLAALLVAVAPAGASAAWIDHMLAESPNVFLRLGDTPIPSPQPVINLGTNPGDPGDGYYFFTLPSVVAGPWPG